MVARREIVRSYIAELIDQYGAHERAVFPVSSRQTGLGAIGLHRELAQRHELAAAGRLFARLRRFPP